MFTLHVQCNRKQRTQTLKPRQKATLSTWIPVCSSVHNKTSEYWSEHVLWNTHHEASIQCDTFSKAPDGCTVDDRAGRRTRATHRSKPAKHHNTEHGNTIQMQMDKVELMQQTSEAVSGRAPLRSRGGQDSSPKSTSFYRLQTPNDYAGGYYAQITPAKHYKP